MDNYIKALHIIFVVTWFSGLFYIVRLFIYHCEAQSKEETERKILIAQFKLMEKRLWYGITWPSAVLTIILGSWLYSFNFTFYLQQSWMLLKLIFVGLLFLYHLHCHRIFQELQEDRYSGTSMRLRIFNEIATLLLFAIVFLVVLKSNSGLAWGLLALSILSAIIFSAVYMYKKKREKTNSPKE